MLKIGKKTLSYKKTLEKKLFFRYLLHANSSGVAALVNDKNKRIYIFSSKNIMKTLGNVVSELANNTFPSKQMKRDKRHLRIVLLEQTTELYVSKLKWCDGYISNGYTLYNPEKLPKYEISLVTMKSDNNGFTVRLQLVSAGKRYYPIREFSSQQEAIQFAEEKGLWELIRLTKN